MDSYSEEDLLGWLFKDNLQNIEFVELNIAPENPGLAPQTQPQAPSQIPLAPKPVEVERPTVSGLQKTQKRFKTVTSEELKDLQESRQAKSTKQNTKWGVKVFQEWCMEALDQVLDFATTETEELNNVLGKFYAEATPKFSEKRGKEMSTAQSKEYHKNSMKNIRAAINRHIHDLDRDIDIVRDKEFRKANETLDGKLKKNLEKGLSRPTKHKQIITMNDLEKINSYLYSSDDPIILRFRVWYNIAMHFVTRGIEFHQQLQINSFEFLFDEKNREYACLSHEMKQKNWQGGLDSGETMNDKRMYSCEGDRCPVASLKLLILKTDPDATSLFNHINKDALSSKTPNILQLLYTNKSVKSYQFTRFMADVSKNASCSVMYTAHCLRATAIQAMSDAGFEIRHIMYMSGHRNEASVRRYSRDCSTLQKKSMSDTLSTLSTGRAPPQTAMPMPMAVQNKPASVSSVLAARDTPNVNTMNTALSSNNFMSSGFISNSSFHNCTFQINNPQ
ncbi:uncharacterized protein LOC127738312 [Mytilus californianus]|uniref:uncharacterized protein LOC127738312 n=1 Tax=Mytilus californianus TaxID=6549 RepID=UPI0022471192|nr:uncharacterized protein LOC127738312 [Mytilus californianus]